MFTKLSENMDLILDPGSEIRDLISVRDPEKKLNDADFNRISKFSFQYSNLNKIVIGFIN